MSRMWMCLLILPVLLAACASNLQGPQGAEPPVECANPPAEGEKDGGLGGTGNAPPPCDAEGPAE
jgi:hypothetical protein